MNRESTVQHVAAIANAAWWVRWYCRPHQGNKKAEAVTRLGLVVRRAFSNCEDFGPLLEAIRDALT